VIHFSLSLSDEEERWKGREGKKEKYEKGVAWARAGRWSFLYGGPLRTNVGGKEGFDRQRIMGKLGAGRINTNAKGRKREKQESQDPSAEQRKKSTGRSRKKTKQKKTEKRRWTNERVCRECLGGS
jgi:hypothetical protein